MNLEELRERSGFDWNKLHKQEYDLLAKRDCLIGLAGHLAGRLNDIQYKLLQNREQSPTVIPLHSIIADIILGQ